MYRKKNSRPLMFDYIEFVTSVRPQSPHWCSVELNCFTLDIAAVVVGQAKCIRDLYTKAAVALIPCLVQPREIGLQSGALHLSD